MGKRLLSGYQMPYQSHSGTAMRFSLRMCGLSQTAGVSICDSNDYLAKIVRTSAINVLKTAMLFFAWNYEVRVNVRPRRQGNDPLRRQRLLRWSDSIGSCSSH